MTVRYFHIWNLNHQSCAHGLKGGVSISAQDALLIEWQRTSFDVMRTVDGSCVMYNVQLMWGYIIICRHHQHSHHSSRQNIKAISCWTRNINKCSFRPSPTMLQLLSTILFLTTPIVSAFTPFDTIIARHPSSSNSLIFYSVVDVKPISIWAPAPKPTFWTPMNPMNGQKVILLWLARTLYLNRQNERKGEKSRRVTHIDGI